VLENSRTLATLLVVPAQAGTRGASALTSVRRKDRAIADYGAR